VPTQENAIVTEKIPEVEEEAKEQKI